MLRRHSGILCFLVFALLVSLATASYDQCKNDTLDVISLTYVSLNVSLVMIDSTGKGWGDLGKFEPCINVGDGAVTKYCVVIQEDSMYYGFMPKTQGLCVPTTCDDESLLKVIQNASQSGRGGEQTAQTVHDDPRIIPSVLTGQLNRRLLAGPNGQDIEWLKIFAVPFFSKLAGENTQVHCYDGTASPMTTTAWCAIGLILLLGFFAVVGSLLELWRCGVNSNADPFADVAFGDTATIPHVDTPRSLTSTDPDFDVDEQHDLLKHHSSSSSSSTWTIREMCSTFLLSFSMPTNSALLFEPSDGQFRFLHGMRVLSVMWIILVHSLLYMGIVGFDNPDDVLPPDGAFSSFLFQIVLGGTFAVDTFFFMSGFLVAYSLVSLMYPSPQADLGFGLTPRATGTVSSAFRPLMYYLHRFIRLVPTYAVCIFLYTSLLPHIGQGPFMYRSKELSDACTDYWWTNLLFINNLYPEHDKCFHWGWYLACDMQFYWLTPVLVYTYIRHRTMGLALPFVLITGSVCYLAVEWESSSYSPSVFSDGFFDAVDFLYFKPWVRCETYLVGVIVGYLVWEFQDRRRVVVLHRPNVYWKSWFLGLSALVLLSVPVFVPYTLYQDVEPSWTRAENILYGSLSRLSWGLGLAALFALCFNPSEPSIVESFLAHPAWIPLARLSYSAFLIHPLFIFCIYLNRTTLFHYDPFAFASQYGANVVFSYALAFVLFVLVERPAMNLERVMVEAAGRWSFTRSLKGSRRAMAPSNDLSDVTYEQ
eukprot:TRINITY_DN1782_c0_g1::TRINITY_DN1782_c0_g1_i1::g.25168::m.25168 TRINITY_DN1782_c0_g1::TRINITY_DN1782_c0_g1_i1::g.25168  ORF type:complete len:761 (-),score=100.30,sp/Q09225/NRF6_CAEEL/28.78/3e-45,Acyl_transf_3/PF01757.17/4.4e+03,Acyl_transf_3/PF01757.17/6.8e+03,Acyl_transf_3/PF01757.17/2.2e-19 TRINITY_DN1782_c0_g1_i1:273-2555(-)